MGSSFVYECRDKNGTTIAPGSFVEYGTVSSVSIGYKVEEKVSHRTGRVSEVKFTQDGTTVKVSNRVLKPKDVTVIELTDSERELGKIISSCGGSYTYDSLKELASSITRTVTIQNALESSGAVVLGELIASTEPTADSEMIG